VISLLWLSGFASGVVDNIPYTATMLPLVQNIGQHGIPLEPSWWALALGADFGGNATLVGASANVIVASLAARAGHPIRFATFLRYGVVVTVMSLLLSTAYLWVRYLR
jgi:Na+/H+ antiporter NhaD/arsenite permease-like protein